MCVRFPAVLLISMGSKIKMGMTLSDLCLIYWGMIRCERILNVLETVTTEKLYIILNRKILPSLCIQGKGPWLVIFTT